MKKLLIVLAALFFGYQFVLSQVVPNGGFEDWAVADPWSFEEPAFWVTSNLSTVGSNLPINVTKSSDAYKGDYAMKLETLTNPVNGDPFIGGALCRAYMEGRPEKLSGYYKADLAENDGAAVAVLLFSGAAPVGAGEIEFETSVNDYTYFEIEIDYFLPTNPDTMTITAFSSTGDSIIGSVLLLDDLSFDAVNSTSLLDAPKFITRLSPNPASDHILVEVPEGEGAVYFSIMDANGKLLKNVYFKSEINIDIAAFPMGNYFYKVVSQEGLLQDGGKFQIVR
ncbi:MAG TPA: T9SS type A sorting domain-containing protein [Bacteroidetes bacterium]|nr:T9SS type A sorting domain-containing protein [Bacteroidota bacterium]